MALRSKVQPSAGEPKPFRPRKGELPTVLIPANQTDADQPKLVALPFHGDEIVTFNADDGPRVAMRRIVENLGLDWSSQRKKLVDQSQKFMCGDITTRDSLGRLQSMTAMPVSKLALWLATINPNKVRSDLRAKVELYQAESAVALHDYWTKGVAMRGDLDGIIMGLDPKVASQIGGIIKGIVHNQLSVILPQLVQAEIVEHQYVGVRGLTAGEVLDMAGFKDRKGLRGLASFVSGRLRRYHAEKGKPSPIATLGRSTAYVFDRALAREWLDVGGLRSIDMKIEQRRGQTVMKLVQK